MIETLLYSQALSAIITRGLVRSSVSIDLRDAAIGISKDYTILFASAQVKQLEPPSIDVTMAL
jgi:hypothetical protein